MNDLALGILSESIQKEGVSPQANYSEKHRADNILPNDMTPIDRNENSQEVPVGFTETQLNNVTMFLHSSRQREKYPTSSKGKFRVSTIEELEGLSHTLLNKPFIVDLKWEKVEVCFPARVYTAVGEALIYVNSQHSCIRSQLKEGLDEAKRLMRENKKFYLQFDFRAALSTYLCGKIQILDEDDKLEDFRCGYGKISISNCNKYLPVFKFTDKVCPLWVFCSPLCLLSLPCYLLYRKLTCRDMAYDLEVKPKLISNALAEAILNGHLETEENGVTDHEIVTSEVVKKIPESSKSPSKVRRRLKRWVHTVSKKKDDPPMVNNDSETLMRLM
ncbi:uncharacterized protein LOC144434651 [Glandiceps talaboti]